MQFHIGPWVYAVRISESPLRDAAGRPLDGLCCEEDREVIISSAVSRKRRLDVLMHELRHAWAYHLGTPSDPEGDANSASSFVAAMIRQFNRQGGEPALASLGLDGVIDRGVSGDVQAVTGCQCGGCGTSFASSSIVSEPATVDTRSGLLCALRRVYCDHCGHVMQWHEATNQSGVPTGQPLAAPIYLKGEHARAFLMEHGARFGVYV